MNTKKRLGLFTVLITGLFLSSPVFAANITGTIIYDGKAPKI